MLIASLELAERGYKVTLQEASDVLGGRLATRDIDGGRGFLSRTWSSHVV